ncbi:MAG: hypothetical protein ACREQJ_10430 [Candidatus Binatia bacterium]
MRLDSVRALKQELKEDAVLPRVYARAFAPASRLSTLTVRLDMAHTRAPSGNDVALGIVRGKGKRDFRLGARVQVAEPRRAAEIAERLRREARNECDVRIVPRVVARRAPTPAWFLRRRRPIEPGISVGHVKTTAGTLGFFVEDDHAVYVLSNNHVLAEVNAAEPGDPIVQPGPIDLPGNGKAKQRDLIAVLDRFVPISFSRSNVVDCAIAEVLDGIRIVKARTRAVRAKIKGTKPVTVDDLDLEVFKAGRTTGVTSGRITQAEVDRLSVEMTERPVKTALFSDQFEVSCPGRKSFSEGGDSGSLIVDGRGYARGLLFAGGPDEDGNDLTYANQIEIVLAKLGVELVV